MRIRVGDWVKIRGGKNKYLVVNRFFGWVKLQPVGRIDLLDHQHTYDRWLRIVCVERTLTDSEERLLTEVTP